MPFKSSTKTALATISAKNNNERVRSEFAFVFLFPFPVFLSLLDSERSLGRHSGLLEKAAGKVLVIRLLDFGRRCLWVLKLNALDRRKGHRRRESRHIALAIALVCILFGESYFMLVVRLQANLSSLALTQETQTHCLTLLIPNFLFGNTKCESILCLL